MLKKLDEYKSDVFSLGITLLNIITLKIDINLNQD